jgi:hypothetical protein
MTILSESFELLKDDLIKAYDEKGMRASGKWADALEVRQDNPFNVKLLGLEYSQQLEHGRSAGGFPPLEIIEQWILDKNIFATIQGDITLSSLAFLIARKIAREGWKREGYGGVDLLSDVITPKRIQNIINEVGEAQAAVYTTEIMDLIKEVA